MGLDFNEHNSAEDLLVALLKQIEPSLLSPKDGSAVALAPGSLSSRSGGKRSDPLSDTYNSVGSMSKDPYLEALSNRLL